jgi:outer membrane receptor protein involved in Fe transport
MGSWTFRRQLFVSYWLLVLALTPFISVSSYAQVAGANLSGNVTDSTGARLAHAKLEIKNTATGVVTEVSSDATGFYSVPNLLPGIYDVTASVPGFSTQVRTGVTLTVGASQLLNLSLTVGEVTQRVQVQAQISGVDLTSSNISGAVDEITMRELPLNGRDWTALATLEPGVLSVRTQAGTNQQGSRANRGFGNQLTDFGHRPDENNYRLNGISINDYTNSGPGSVLGVNLGVDAIEEFSVITTNYSAEYGRTSGAVINAITKSGTNDFHGNAYWFLRDEGLDARNYFDPPKIAPFHRNQFGASAGGPIRKDRTFIFADYEGIRQDLGVSFRDIVPSQNARNGILSTGNVTVDPKVAPFLGLWPLPNAGLIGPGDTGFFLVSGASVLTENYWTTRVDHKFSERDSLSGSYFWDSTPQTIPDSLNNVLFENFTRRQGVSLEETHSFNSAVVNTLRLGFSRTRASNGNVTAYINPLAQSLAIVPGPVGAPLLNVPGITGESGGQGGSANFYGYNSIQVYDDAFITKGNHSLKLGFNLENIQDNVKSFVWLAGRFDFPSLAGFLTNQPTTMRLTSPNSHRGIGLRQKIIAGYFQDDWRLRPNLTLNLGVRYEMATKMSEVNNLISVVRNLYGGPVVPGNTMWDTNPTTKNFEPRIGFAYDPFKNGKSVIRGGFGIFDVLPLPYLVGLDFATVYPASLRQSVRGTPGGFPDAALPLQNPKDLTATNVLYEPSDPPRSYVMNWNINMQHNLGGNTTLTLGYVGTHGLKESFTNDNVNTVLPKLTSAGYLWPFPVGSGTVLNPLVGPIHPNFFDNSVKYNGFETSIKKTFDRGLLFQGSYTWGHCIDTGTNNFFGDAFTNSIDSLFFFDKQMRHGNCDFDVRQNFVFNSVWQLPKPNFGGAFAKHVLGGWEIGGILIASTGTPFSVLEGGDPLGQIGANSGPFPSQLYGTSGCNNPINPGNVNDYLKLNCFTPPVAPPSFASLCQPAAPSVTIPNTCMNLMGNAGRNQIFGPGLVNLDFSLFKNFDISERLRVQFRTEFFNILNHANFQSPVDNNTVLNQDGTPVAGAGAIESTTTSRQIQLELKVI